MADDFDYEEYYSKLFLNPIHLQEVRMDEDTGDTIALVQHKGDWFVVFDEETATKPLRLQEAKRVFRKYTGGDELVYPTDKRKTRIGSVYVDYWYFDGSTERELSDEDRQHIGKLLKQGYREGELLTVWDAEVHRGWWRRSS